MLLCNIVEKIIIVIFVLYILKIIRKKNHASEVCMFTDKLLNLRDTSHHIHA